MQVSDANVRWSHTNSEMCGDGCTDYSEGFLQEFQSIEFSKKICAVPLLSTKFYSASFLGVHEKEAFHSCEAFC